MKNFRYYILTVFILLFEFNNVCAKDFICILNEKNINNAYEEAEKNIKDKQIKIRKDVRGVIISFLIKNPFNEFECLSKDVKEKLLLVGKFLEKNKKSVIIEVHTAGGSELKIRKLKNWELSQVIAGNVETFILKAGMISYDRIKSVGYGEFLPTKNTPNNGVNNNNSIDIIILCNIDGD